MPNVICKYWLKGKCEFNSKCWYQHNYLINDKYTNSYPLNNLPKDLLIEIFNYLLPLDISNILFEFSNINRINIMMFLKKKFRIFTNLRLVDKFFFYFMKKNMNWIFFNKNIRPNIISLNIKIIIANNDEHLSNKTLNKMKNLTHLYLGKSNKITDEGLKCLKLKYLYLCDNNKITDRCIQTLHELTHLHLGYGKDITNNALLNKKITHLYLGMNNKITDDGIKNLPLKYLDLTYNKIITDNGIFTLNHLYYLKLNSNKITDLGLADLNKLQHLHIYNNNMISINGLINKPLQCLCLESNYNLTDNDIKKLRNVKCLVLNSNKNISNGINCLHYLEHLELGNNISISNNLWEKLRYVSLDSNRIVKPKLSWDDEYDELRNNDNRTHSECYCGKLR